MGGRFMEHACRAITAKSAEVRQYACSTIGNAAGAAAFKQVAPSAASQLARVLQRNAEQHRKRRAVSTDAKQDALAMEAAIFAFGQVCEHQEQNIGGDTRAAWLLWLANLPLRYDQDEAQKVHAQLLALVTRSHPVITASDQLPKVLTVFADVYKTSFSNAILDREIALHMAQAGGALIQNVVGEMPKKQRKRLETILTDGRALM